MSSVATPHHLRDGVVSGLRAVLRMNRLDTGKTGARPSQVRQALRLLRHPARPAAPPLDTGDGERPVRLAG